ncbi:cell envelope-associated transcriptional attenuator LytR-CpsA-Psr [Gracilibacillus boraciitolerans JCM 21714]|uniref:Cell envelope-associated transcriptional attenuator LytR-CpsA-Psr n=1 Tax=Gracilibacillus boraciitolerans JCM 21714 TaxID=1298598 RepID=W4VGX9_9BACI|nr:LCP family protein [Gracilibacillus boraciitolerans]GAE92452.1 cell envelope-associated transcriptional attenuator LytR-CpsA-Psr [Gracilibacillus boraciitolerans JCM 21714]
MERKELREQQKKQKKKKRIKTSLLILGLVIVIGISLGAYILFETYQAASGTYDELERGEKSEKREEVVKISQDPISILLMGVEDYSSDGDHGRSDTMIVATFNPGNEKLKLLSIPPRDSYVTIPGREGMDKINHSFAYGGKELTVKTVEELLDIPIDYYATVNFDGFKSIVNTLGGITVDVPFDFEQNSDDQKAEKLQFFEGEMELNGRYALAYARMRLEDPRGDIGRNERQKQVIEAIIKEITSLTAITKIEDLGKNLESNVETNFKVGDGINFLSKYADFRTSNIDQVTLEGSDQYIGNTYYYQLNEESLNTVKHELRVHLEIEEPGQPTEYSQETEAEPTS